MPGRPPIKVRSQFEKLRREDELYWQGWYARNSGSIVFLGDCVGGWPIGRLPAAAVVVGFLGLIGAMSRELLLLGR